jgi:hypothetical protein
MCKIPTHQPIEFAPQPLASLRHAHVDSSFVKRCYSKITVLILGMGLHFKL